MDGVAVDRGVWCTDSLLALLHSFFEQVPDKRRKPKYSLADVLSAGVALFHLKEPSLLSFEDKLLDENLRTLYQLRAVPGDTQMRQTLDDVDPEDLRSAYNGVIDLLLEHKMLTQYEYFDDAYIIALDGTEFYTSEKIHCKNCMQRKVKGGGVAYYHQMFGAVLLHPDHAEVFPLPPEPIQRHDGETKNDCERNAARRWLKKFRQDRPDLNVVIVEDGLSSNGPHIRDLIEHDCRFILGVKEDDHTALQRVVAEAAERGEVQELHEQDGKIKRTYYYIENVPLNDSHPDLMVNYLEYIEEGPKGTLHFIWVTDLPLNRETVKKVMRAGRARWKIENETFNTLKNQGYHFEHNFGHGYNNLSVVFSHLMLLAFLIDQVQQRFNQTFKDAYRKAGSKQALWERVRTMFFDFRLPSFEHIYEVIAYGMKQRPLLPAANRAPSSA